MELIIAGHVSVFCVHVMCIQAITRPVQTSTASLRPDVSPSTPVEIYFPPTAPLDPNISVSGFVRCRAYSGMLPSFASTISTLWASISLRQKCLVIAKTRLFADDCVIYRPIKTTKDCLQLQEDLHRLAEWEDKWGMCFHPEKCSILRVTRARSPVLHPYTLKGQILHTDEQSKYLGVDITSNLSWNPHIGRIVKKGNSMLGFLQRNLRVNSRETKASAYFTLGMTNRSNQVDFAKSNQPIKPFFFFLFFFFFFGGGGGGGKCIISFYHMIQYVFLQ